MRNYAFLLLLLVANLAANAQTPVLKWNKMIGGSNSDRTSYADTQTANRPKIKIIDRDGHYLIAGDSWSNDGDVHTRRGSNDLFFAKVDTQRNIVWSKSLGGYQDEYLQSFQPAEDSGYILSATSASNDTFVVGNHGTYDMWVVRLGNSGQVVWQRCFGGTGGDSDPVLSRIPNGYILTGTTGSNNGDVSGNHGGTDIWVAKLDATGNILWQKCLGGTQTERAADIRQTADSGYIVLGTTVSDDGDVSGRHGAGTTEADIWVVKLDKDGNIQWQKCLGGSGSESAGDIEITSSGGYLIAGLAYSTDGDVVGNHGNGFSAEGWLVSLTPAGAIGWQKCLGGAISESIADILPLPDNSYALLGLTNSTNGDISFNYGYYDAWLLKISNTGNIIWQKTFGGTSTDDGAIVALNSAGNFVVLGTSYSNNFDASGNHGQDDIWLFEAGAGNTIAGFVFYDVNSNGIKDPGETYFDKVSIRNEKGSEVITAIPYHGYYSLNVEQGTYTTTAIPYNTTYFNAVPASKTTVFSTYFNTDPVHFAIQPNPNITDANINMVPLMAARPGFQLQYQIDYNNVGTNAIPTGKIKFKKDSRLVYTTAQPAPDMVNGDSLIFDFNNLASNTSRRIVITLQVPGLSSTLHLGDTLQSVTLITHGLTDLTPADDTITVKQLITGSYDPNDKTEANAGAITPAQVNEGDYLHYLIRFQNTGTDTAFNVTIRDTLESRLDWSTLQMLNASHAYQLTIEEGNKLAWFFPNIKLPDSNVYEPGSHGFISFQIKPKNTVVLGDTIKNTAGIYFDFNPPVATNQNKTIVMILSSLPVTLTSFRAAQNNDVVDITWTIEHEVALRRYEVLRSANGIDFTSIGTMKPGKTSYLFKDQQPLAGFNYYRLKMVDIDSSIDYSAIALVNVKDAQNIISSIYPNPGDGRTVNVKLQNLHTGKISIQVLDQLGRVLLTKQYGRQAAGSFKTELNLGQLSRGTYILKIVANEAVYMHTLLLKN